MRLGTICTGTTTRTRTGAFTRCSCWASWMSCSDSGCTSQNVSVKSNGVCETPQKFAYVRSVPPGSAGTIVKFTWRGSSATVVSPAASLPFLALEAGARVIEVNPHPTPLTRQATVSLRGSAGEILPQLA